MKMKSLILIVLIAVSFEGISLVTAGNFKENDSMESEDSLRIEDTPENTAWWEDYKKEFGKNYSWAEDLVRKDIFLKNKMMIEKHNEEFERGLHTFKMGLYEHSDWTEEELFLYKTGAKMTTDDIWTDLIFEEYIPSRDIKLPKSIDWREKGAVTAVKQQGGCGSCWVFSAVGVLESQYFMKKKNLITFSEQYVMDCGRGFNTYGCGASWEGNALAFVQNIGGADTEAEYPYRAKNEECKNILPQVHFNISKVVRVKVGNESELQKALAEKGPISVGIWIGKKFSHFKEGMATCEKGHHTMNHAVLLVGYGEDERFGPYWLIKNSWGKQWGQGGYARIARNRGNECLIATFAIYPEIE